MKYLSSLFWAPQSANDEGPKDKSANSVTAPNEERIFPKIKHQRVSIVALAAGLSRLRVLRLWIISASIPRRASQPKRKL